MAEGKVPENVEMMVISSRDKSITIETMTKMSDLPVNLVEEILSRVPLKSKTAVRLTCKQWDALFKSPSFSKIHADKLRAVREGESMILALMDYNLYLTRVVLVDKVVVWNPYWVQTRLIESRHPWGRKRLCLALGYKDKGSSPSYKFLRFIDVWSRYEIYDFDSSSWKDLDITQHWCIYFSQCGVTLKGNTYWPASQGRNPDH